MSAEHTDGELQFTESPHEANRFTINVNGHHWLMSILHNGEPLKETQRENMRRLVACWNACKDSSTEWLELQCKPGVIERLEAELQAVVACGIGPKADMIRAAIARAKVAPWWMTASGRPPLGGPVQRTVVRQVPKRDRSNR